MTQIELMQIFPAITAQGEINGRYWRVYCGVIRNINGTDLTVTNGFCSTGLS